MERNMVAKTARRKAQDRPETVSVSDAADRLGELVGRVADGETVILTRYNLPIARLVPLDPAA
jgi:prevent-host-death family protein